MVPQENKGKCVAERTSKRLRQGHQKQSYTKRSIRSSQKILTLSKIFKSLSLIRKSSTDKAWIKYMR